MILVFSVLSFRSSFSLFSFTLIKRLFSSSSFSAIKVVSSVYLRLLVFLPTIFIPACDSSFPAFCTMYSARKLNKQGDNIQPCHTPFPILNQSVGSVCSSINNCCFLIRIHTVSQEVSKVVWYSHFFKNFPHLVVIHTVKGASLIAQLVKNLPAMQETPVQFLGCKDPLEKGKATHSGVLGLP